CPGSLSGTAYGFHDTLDPRGRARDRGPATNVGQRGSRTKHTPPCMAQAPDPGLWGDRASSRFRDLRSPTFRTVCGGWCGQCLLASAPPSLLPLSAYVAHEIISD